MTNTPLPGSFAVRDVLCQLTGKDIQVAQGESWATDPHSPIAIALYVDSALTVRAAFLFDVASAASLSAALGLLPRAGVEDAARAGALLPVQAEIFGEVANVLGVLFNADAAPHLKLHQVLLPGDEVPPDIRALCLRLGSRIDLTCKIPGYIQGSLAAIVT